MNDPISIIRAGQLHPKWKNDAISFINDCEIGLNITLRIIQGFRSFQVQEALYDQGRGTPGPIVTNAKPGQSSHQYGLAVDLCRMLNGLPDWNYDNSALVPYMGKYGISWGGCWHSITDKPHFENTYGLTWEQLYAKYNAQDFIPGTQFVNIP